MKPFQTYTMTPTQSLWVCPICGDVFTRKQLLKAHLLSREKQDEEATEFRLQQAYRITAKEASDIWLHTEGSRYADFLKKVYPNQPKQGGF